MRVWLIGIGSIGGGKESEKKKQELHCIDSGECIHVLCIDYVYSISLFKLSLDVSFHTEMSRDKIKEALCGEFYPALWIF